MELLNATESYLWVSEITRVFDARELMPDCSQRAIRGSGLAYGAYLGADTEVGTISFMLYRVRVSEKGYRA